MEEARQEPQEEQGLLPSLLAELLGCNQDGVSLDSPALQAVGLAQPESAELAFVPSGSILVEVEAAGGVVPETAESDAAEQTGDIEPAVAEAELAVADAVDQEPDSLLRSRLAQAGMLGSGDSGVPFLDPENETELLLAQLSALTGGLLAEDGFEFEQDGTAEALSPADAIQDQPSVPAFEVSPELRAILSDTDEFRIPTPAELGYADVQPDSEAAEDLTSDHFASDHLASDHLASASSTAEPIQGPTTETQAVSPADLSLAETMELQVPAFLFQDASAVPMPEGTEEKDAVETESIVTGTSLAAPETTLGAAQYTETADAQTTEWSEDDLMSQLLALVDGPSVAEESAVGFAAPGEDPADAGSIGVADTASEFAAGDLAVDDQALQALLNDSLAGFEPEIPVEPFVASLSGENASPVHPFDAPSLGEPTPPVLSVEEEMLALEAAFASASWAQPVPEASAEAAATLPDLGNATPEAVSEPSLGTGDEESLLLAQLLGGWDNEETQPSVPEVSAVAGELLTGAAGWESTRQPDAVLIEASEMSLSVSDDVTAFADALPEAIAADQGALADLSRDALVAGESTVGSAAVDPAAVAGADVLLDDLLAALGTEDEQSQQPVRYEPKSRPGQRLPDARQELDRLVATTDAELASTVSLLRERTLVTLQADRHIAFVAGKRLFALPLDSVLETDLVPRVTFVPGVGGSVRGVANVRGELLSVVDLRDLLSIETHDRVHERLLVVRKGRRAVAGFVIDNVLGIVPVRSEDRQPVPDIAEDPAAQMLDSVVEYRDRLMGVLDAGRLVTAAGLDFAQTQ